MGRFSSSSRFTGEDGTWVSMELIERLASLEALVLQTPSMAKDFRVIEMQLSRAEDKVMRIGRGSSWTQSDLPLRKTEDL